MRRLPIAEERLKKAGQDDISMMYIEPIAERQKRIGDAIPALAEGNDRWRMAAERQLDAECRQRKLAAWQEEAERLAAELLDDPT